MMYRIGWLAILWSCLAAGRASAQVIAHWSFDTPSITVGDNGRILTAQDTTANHHATGVFNGDINLANITSVPGPFGQAAMFANGTGSQGTNNASFIFPQIFEIMGPDAGDFTVAAWVNTTDTSTTKAIIADWGTAPAGQNRFTYWFPIHNALPRGQIRWTNTDTPADVIATTVGSGNSSGVTTVADGQWHHVAFVWEQGPGQMHFYIDGQFAQTSTTSQIPAQRYVLESDSSVGAIGRKSDTNNFMIGSLDEIWVIGSALSASEVLGLKETNSFEDTVSLRLQIDPVSGMVLPKNATANDVTLNRYHLASSEGSLNPAGWKSIAASPTQAGFHLGDGSGNGWESGDNPSEHEIFEYYLLGNSTLAAGASISLGKAFDATVNVQDVTFQYLADAGLMRSAIVEYAAIAGVAGDYNGDGVVDAADYTVWRDLLGTETQLQNEGAGVTPGMVTEEDYETWKANFGMTFADGSSLPQSTAIPEPATSVILLALLVPSVCAGRRPCQASAQSRKSCEVGNMAGGPAGT